MLEGVEMHGGHNIPPQRHNVDGTHVEQWYQRGNTTLMEEGTTRGTHGDGSTLFERRQTAFAVMPDIADLELELGTRACETDTLPCVSIMLVVLELLATAGAHVDVNIVAPRELSPRSTNY